jgi:hypothetical protein
MPRYFFDIKHGHQHIPDPAGLECANKQFALTVARTIAEQIAIELPDAEQVRCVVVRNEQGDEVGSVDVT